VSNTVSLVAPAARLGMTIIHGVNLLTHFIVLLLLGGAGYLGVFAPDQLNALVMVFLNAYDYGFTIGIVFLFLHSVILGSLIIQSGYFPKILGILFIIASFGYLRSRILARVVLHHDHHAPIRIGKGELVFVTIEAGHLQHGFA
jgi:hypothetical protein